MLYKKKKKKRDNPTIKGTNMMMPDIFLVKVRATFVHLILQRQYKTLIRLKYEQRDTIKINDVYMNPLHDFLCSRSILIWFPSTSQKVPQVSNAFPQNVPNSTTLFIPFTFAEVELSYIYNIIIKMGQRKAPFVLLFWECLMFQNKIGNGPIKVAPSPPPKKKKKKTLWGHPQQKKEKTKKKKKYK